MKGELENIQLFIVGLFYVNYQFGYFEILLKTCYDRFMLLQGYFVQVMDVKVYRFIDVQYNP